MRISDWSSDVCSSDLVQPAAPAGATAPESPRDTRRNQPRWSEGMLSLHYGDRDDAGIRALSVPADRLPAGRLYHPTGRTGERNGTGTRPPPPTEERHQRPAGRTRWEERSDRKEEVEA